METGGLVQWIQDNVVSLIILILALCVLWAARGGNISKAVTIIAGVFLGLAVLGLAVGGNASSVGAWLIGLFGIG